MKLRMCEWEGSPLAVIVDVASDRVLRACRAWHRDRVMSADIDAAVAMLKDEQVRNTAGLTPNWACCCSSGVAFFSVLQPSSIRGSATPWTYFLHLSLSSIILIDAYSFPSLPPSFPSLPSP